MSNYESETQGRRPYAYIHDVMECDSAVYRLKAGECSGCLNKQSTYLVVPLSASDAAPGDLMALCEACWRIEADGPDSVYYLP